MIGLLRDLGLTPYETKIYVALLEYGKMTAKRISVTSTVPPTAVYPNLKSLIEKQLIQQFDGSVSEYEAVDPELAIPAYVDRMKKGLNTVADELLQQVESIADKKNVQQEKEIMSFYKGKEFSVRLYLDALKETNKTFYVLGWKFEKVKGSAFQLLHSFKKAIKRGVDVRLILVGSKEKAWKVVDEYVAAGVRVRYFPLKNFSIYIADGKKCKMTAKRKEYQERYHVRVEDEDLSEALQTYFLHIWKKAKSVELLQR